MDIANVLLRVLDIADIAVKAAIYSIIAFITIRRSIISAVTELKKQNIL
ncbi:MAG: hypothetical protein RR636_12410 [Clostridium sp.]